MDYQLGILQSSVFQCMIDGELDRFPRIGLGDKVGRTRLDGLLTMSSAFSLRLVTMTGVVCGAARQNLLTKSISSGELA